MKALLLSVFLVLGFQAFAGVNPSGSYETGIKYDPSLPSYQGFISVSNERELYVEYVKAQPKQPTVVLLNGLTYSTRQWDEFVKPLIAKGVGVLRYDMYGQGQTLLRYAPVFSKIPHMNQVEDLHALLEKMKIPGPHNILGLSYGGGIAVAYANTYPNEVNKVILMAPYTQPVEGQDVWIKAQIWATRQIFPLVKLSDDELYDIYLQQIVYATYPQAEPIVLENPFKLEAVFRMAQGIRAYRPLDDAYRLPEGKVHLIMSVQDQYVPVSVLETFWDKVPAASKASRLMIYGTEHKIPEVAPRFSASWVYEIITNNPQLTNGADFEGFPYRNEVRSKDGNTIKVGQK